MSTKSFSCLSNLSGIHNAKLHCRIDSPKIASYVDLILDLLPHTLLLTLQVKMIGATSKDQEKKMFLDCGRAISSAVARAT